MKLSTGIEKLDEILDGGIDSHSSVLILTDTMVDKATFAQHILSRRIMEGDKAIYLTTTKLPSKILKNMYNHGFETEGIVFIDCISHTLGKESPEKFVLQEKLTEVENAWKKTIELMDRALRETEGFKFFVFDCLESFMGLGAETISKEIEKLKEDARDLRTTFLFLFTDWGYEKEEIEKLKKSFDKVIELGTIEKKLIWMNYFTVEGKPKVLFAITPAGVGVYVPKILVTGPYHAGKSSLIKLLSEKSVSVDRLGTTIALDHGYIEKKGLVCDIFGTPGQERFDWILKILAKDTWGVILVVDSTKPETFPRALEMLNKVKGEGIAFVVFANKQDLPNALKPEEVKKKLGVPDVIGTSVIKGEGCEEGLKMLFDKIFKLRAI